MQKILAVDDEVENLSMVEYTLQDEFEVIPVNSGIVALKYLEKQKPDLILLDIRMPQMDGITTMEKMKEIPGVEEIPVMFLTSASEIETEYTCFEMGAVDFIRKPFEPKIMKQRIKRTLRLFQPTTRDASEATQPEQTVVENPTVELLINGINVSIRENDIMYIEVYNNNSMIKTIKQEWNIRMTLDRLQDMLVSDFIRTGRSYLINPRYVKGMEDDYVIMEDGNQIKLPRRNKKELQTAITASTPISK